ncbi:hypothetical protein [Chryseobacterium sp. JAH]|uniref:hypothetical protein n=1 Tax=Chryseobacterium sp. JAH TaxID=1742858 RepID=UPI00074113B4|nr:hypothetical protein [Chryseobacterium sp. JAH]KUJ50906.1 hypothetical protein AR685_11765 [Chryseobacterium sp. JAH]
MYYTNTVYPTSFSDILSISYYDTYPQGSPARPSSIFGKVTIADDLSQITISEVLYLKLMILPTSEQNFSDMS